jgi:hypothetical protein
MLLRTIWDAMHQFFHGAIIEMMDDADNPSPEGLLLRRQNPVPARNGTRKEYKM